MKIKLEYLLVRTKQTTEKIAFSKSATFLYGPIGKGKSTVARLIDYCFGGDLERTPAIQQEFLSSTLGAQLGKYKCTFERGASDTQVVRVTWDDGIGNFGSVNAPLLAADISIINAEVYNLSDLLFYLCGVDPIKVLKKSRDPDSQMIRLSFRDIWWYCYLDQTHLDSSFFRLEDPFRGRKSQDAMRFFTGLHSERLSQLQVKLYRTLTDQQGAREAVAQIRQFMERFDFGSDFDNQSRVDEIGRRLKEAGLQKKELEEKRLVELHPTDLLREKLRELSFKVSDLKDAISNSNLMIAEQEALRAEFITAKIKSERSEQARGILEGVSYSDCPECGTDITHRPQLNECCRLCKTSNMDQSPRTSTQLEVLRRELNDRIDQIADSINRRTVALERSIRKLENVEAEKEYLDKKLQDEISRYDSAFIENIRGVDREVATLTERRESLIKFQKMTEAITEQERKAGELQGTIDNLRSKIQNERALLKQGDENAKKIAEKFKSIMLEVGFPGVSSDDSVILDPRNWKPIIVHNGQDWGFWDTGSGGKKTLFNVCYALSIHEVAKERGLPVPSILIIDSPTKNISEDENPELVKSLYEEIYRSASKITADGTQLLLIDSDLYVPSKELDSFKFRHMSGETDAPSLIPYYDGP